jgi:curved DNA-binding protein CbpA
MKTYYDILGVNKHATTSEIKTAYRKLSIKFHPDKNDGDEFFKEMFLNINTAYEILSNAEKRNDYDKLIKNEQIEIQHSFEYDELIVKAAVYVVVENNPSTAFIQRKFSIGYTRAMEISKQLVKLGIVSSYPNATVLVNQNGLEHILLTQLPDRTIDFIETSRKSQEFIEKKEYNENVNATYKEEVNPIWNPVIFWRKVKWTLIFIDLILVFLVFVRNNNNTSNKVEFIQVISEKGLNMRSEPNYNSNVLLTIPNNEQVTLISTEGPSDTISGKTSNWLKVEYNGERGWIWGGFTNYNK